MAIERVSVWAEVDEFLTSTPTPEQILAFRPSDAMQARVSALLEANRQGTLSQPDRDELNDHMAVETFMRRLKAKAITKLHP